MSKQKMIHNENISPLQRLIILIAIAIAYLVVMMDYSIINVALQTIQEDFSASNAQLQWTVSSYEIFYAALLLPAGFLADRYGRKRLLILGLGIFLIGAGLITTAMTANQIIIWRIVMGIGGAVVPATTLAIIKHVFPIDKQAQAMGVWSAVGGASVAVGPILGGFLVQYFAWWSIFLINVPIVAICIFIVWRNVPESSNSSQGRLDIVGMILAMLSVATLTFGLIRGGETGIWTAFDTTGAIIVGVILLVILIFIEKRQTVPMLDVYLLRNRAFAVGTMSISLAYFALTGGTFLLVFYVQLIRGQTPFELGLSMLPVAIGAVVGSLLAEKMVQRFGVRLTISTALLILASGFTLFAFANAETSQFWIEVAFLGAGLGMGVTMGTTTPLTMGEVPKEKAGSAAGLTNTIRGLTSIIGVAILGAVYSLRYQSLITPLLDESLLSSGANQSLSQTLTALRDTNHLDSTGITEITLQANNSFISSFHASMWVAVGVIIVGMVLSYILLPRKTR